MLCNGLRKHEEKFFNYCRMSVKSFDELLTLIRQQIEGQNTNFRDCICPEEKLMVTTLRLALDWLFVMGYAPYECIARSKI